MAALTRTLHYPGDHPELVGVIVGPNTMREYLTIVAVEYDAEADVTTATLRYGKLDVRPEAAA